MSGKARKPGKTAAMRPIHGIDAVGQHRGQDRHHLPIAVMRRLQSASDTLHRGLQSPVPEWRAIAQRTGLAGEYRDVMPGIVDRLVAPEGAGMLGNDHAVLTDDDPIRIGVDLDRPADGRRQDRVFVVVEAHRAGLRHRGRHRVEPVEGAAVFDQLAALLLEHVPDRSFRLFDMTVRLGVGAELPIAMTIFSDTKASLAETSRTTARP